MGAPIAMSAMSELLSKLDAGSNAHASFDYIIEAAESAGGGYRLSAQERADLLTILTPAANAINGRFLYSYHVDASAIAKILRRRRHDDWDECKDAVTSVEAKVRLGTGPLERADIHAIRHVFDALGDQCSYLEARIGGY